MPYKARHTLNMTINIQIHYQYIFQSLHFFSEHDKDILKPERQYSYCNDLNYYTWICPCHAILQNPSSHVRILQNSTPGKTLWTVLISRPGQSHFSLLINKLFI
jgi:hypothetical protein